VRDIFTLAHPTLKTRRSSDDPRGLFTFTDFEPYAEFAVRQIEESKLIVPWARKRPALFSRWDPLPTDEFATRGRIVPIAVSKSAPTTANAMAVIKAYDYRRRYYDKL
jgi:UDP-N-acetylglucosamine pyrophosphorylase